ncbi:MAG: MATE family efflux transporter, partial [Clostridia bacterium]|nr:MATE family efflux transporter [Clostridia bacterium]
MKKSSTNLTTGNITKQILAFAVPIFVGQLFQTLYNSVDSIVVGNAVGTTALAAVSASADISHLLVGFFTGLSTGAGVLFSRSFGAGDHKKLHDAIHTALTFSLILGVAMAVLGIVISPLLLNIVDCPPDVYEEALLYLRIYLVGVLFTALYNVGAGVLRAVGDSKNPLYFLVISSVTNIILDVLLVVVFPLGVAGAALATVGSQFVSVFLVFRKMLFTNDVYKLVLRDLHINKQLLMEVLDLGLPAAIQACLTSISNLFVTRYINSFGSAAMAGIGAGKKIDRFAGMVAQSLGLATSTFVGQNVGAKKIGRAFQGIRVCLIAGFAYVAVVGTAIYFNAEPLARIFTSDAAAISYGVAMITTMIPLYFCQAFNQIIANAVRGFGKSRVVMVCSLSGMIVCRQIFL